MCTVSIIPCPEISAVRVACNRDEQAERPTALPPAILRIGVHRTIFPVDPISGGTWIAVTDAGLAMVLLNRNAADGSIPTGVLTSRGTIIPALANVDSLPAAVSQALELNAGQYLPFRLVLADRERIGEISSDGTRLEILRIGRLTAPALFTSSGLGDRLVDGPRQRLFAQCFRSRNQWTTQQEAFHRHIWPDEPHLSVCMSRPGARTVSYTVVCVGRDQVRMDYHPNSPIEPAERHVVILHLAKGGAA